mmetsp:Transcript_49984/g.79637  ORF Transcript_49984/g.79637 Transcript_49984/m.79637 type:complete len:96 (-) Transcript_49984:241-528(-)
MGNKFLSPPKLAGTLCSEDGCYNACVSSSGHRMRHPHKARCCSVCSKWYCSEHKAKHLRYTDIYPIDVCSPHDIHRPVYKCAAGDCLSMHGKHRS